MSNKPRISILVPVRNGDQHIRQTLNSILEIPDAEVMVSDNFSVDKTREVLDEFSEIEVIRPKSPLSMIENWNFVTNQASTEFYKMVSHDDLVNVDSVESQIRALENNPSFVFSFASRNFLFETQKRNFLHNTKNPKQEKIIPEVLTLLKMVCRTGTNPIGETLCVTFRKSNMEQFNSWNDIKMIYELETYARALRRGPAIWVLEKAGCFRIHSGGYSATIESFFMMATKVRDWTQDQP